MSEEVVETPKKKPPVLELKGVGRTFVGPTGRPLEAIRDVNLTIEDVPGIGEFRSLLGPSGSGKSTILNLIAGLDKPTVGTVKIDGKIVDGPGPQVGMVFQNYSSMPWMTVLQNVSYGLKLQGVSYEEREERAMELVRRVGLLGHEKKYPQTLSGGMRQRVALARTLAVKPRIILMDEPFGALDVRIRVETQDLVMEMWEELEPTIILVTHDIGEAVYMSDTIYVLSAEPGTVIDKISVDLPHPRKRDMTRTERFRHLENRVLNRLHELSEGKPEDFRITI